MISQLHSSVTTRNEKILGQVEARLRTRLPLKSMDEVRAYCKVFNHYLEAAEARLKTQEGAYNVIANQTRLECLKGAAEDSPAFQECISPLLLTPEHHAVAEAQELVGAMGQLSSRLLKEYRTQSAQTKKLESQKYLIK